MTAPGRAWPDRPDKVAVFSQLFRHTRIKAILFAILGFTCFGTADVVFKYLGGQIPIYGATFFTGVFASFFLLLTSPYLGGVGSTFRSRKIGLHIPRSLVLFTNFVLIVYAFQNMAIAKVYTLVFLYPIMGVMLGMALFKDKIFWPQWVAILVGFAAVLIILRPGMIPVEPPALAGLAVAVLVAIANPVMTRYIGDQAETKLSFALYPELVMALGGGLLWMPDAIIPGFAVIGFLLVTGALHAGGMLFASLAFAATSAGVVAPFTYWQMVWGILLSALFFNETFDAYTLCGVILISGAGLGIIFYQAYRDKRLQNFADRLQNT